MKPQTIPIFRQGNSAEPTSHDVPRVTVAGNELAIFLESPPLIEAMVRDIQSAQKRVWLEVYIFLNDAAGAAIADALKERAQAGVDVRVHYDAIGSQTTPATFFRDLGNAGVQVYCFHSLLEALWRFSFSRILNRRNHRKLLVIDDAVAYFGGMNIVDQTNQATLERAEPWGTSAGWRDVHVRLTGPQQADVAESFERSWRRAALKEKVPWRPLEYRRALLPAGEESIRFFDTGRGRKYAPSGRIFSRLINRARYSITLSMAYFIPVGRVLRDLLAARRRGVRIRVVVPGYSDVKLAQWATKYLYARLLRRRIRIYERQISMLHSKVMVVDDEWTLVGSCNLDPRSLFINLEFLAVIRSKALARAMTDVCRFEMAHSERVTSAALRQRPWWQRLRDRLAWAFRWWL